MGTAGAIWGLGAIFLLIGSAVFRLSFHALELAGMALTTSHWAALFFSLFFMAYAEGYKGFQKRFSPRTAARARFLKNHGTLRDALLAPFFCMAFYRAPWRRVLSSWLIFSVVICFVLVVSHLSQPWRGIVDAGVVLGLIWGLVTLLFCAIKAFFSKQYDISPEIPQANH
jgi:hypothetical protein